MHSLRSILHVDMDAFYAAVEILDDPSLAGKPLIIGHEGGRGVVTTCSYEARAFGVHSAMPSVTAARLCPQAIWRPNRGKRYAEISREIRAIFDRFTPAVEPVSVDEAYLDLTGTEKLFGPPAATARRLKDTIQAEILLTASVGLAPTKLLAKIASDLEKPDGFVVVPPPPAPAGDLAAIDAWLAPLPVKRLWGVGPKRVARLNQAGIETIGDIWRAELDTLGAVVGSEHVDSFLRWSHGLDRREVHPRDSAQQISHEETYRTDRRGSEQVAAALWELADKVAARLRTSRCRALGVTLKVRTAQWKNYTRSQMLLEPTDLAEPLHAVALDLWRSRLSLERHPIRLLGVAATPLIDEDQVQPGLFADPVEEKQRHVATALDQIRGKFGKKAIRRASDLET
ncbi:MAG TPA: DNA polymerase IV [Planctomycetota bacterium]|nr:DNA polymerase IV [Planctomycetota bacterium]